METIPGYQELSKSKPHILLTQENTQIKELQQENKGMTPIPLYLKGISNDMLLNAATFLM